MTAIKTTPRVSIVMPVFRPNAKFLGAAIDSVQSQSFSDWELVIVEDPSDRLGRDEVEKRNDRRIHYFLNLVRTGLAHQHNQAVAIASGTLIARFDADDICEPDRLEKQVLFLESHPEIDVLSSQLRIIDENGATIGWRCYPIDHDAIVKALHRYNPVSGSNAMFRRHVVTAVGGWREDVDLPAQDYEWYSRVASRGFRFATHPDYLVRYRRHGAQIKQTKLRGTILTTLDVKRRYWLTSMDALSFLLFLGEACLLLLPSNIVLWLLRTIPLQSKNRLTK